MPDSQRPVPVSWPPLSPRQIEVIHQIAHGLTSVEAGERLDITEDVVKIHIKKAMRAWGAKSRTHLVFLACKRGVLSLGDTDA